ncbi:MAG: iron transporter [Anaerosporomusa subterranea]|jgi:ferrous iron transport protein B|nr:iron transporter [Anaerosporomusa subterranea]
MDLSVALLGNPNVGKSALFNTLTGGKQEVGNWCGQTTQICTLSVPMPDGTVSFHDLPGVYGLGGYSPEEIMVNQFFRESPPDVVLLMVSATELEHGLYLVLEALERFQRCMVLINKMESALQTGIVIDSRSLEKQLGVRVLTKRELLDKPLLLSVVQETAVKPYQSGYSVQYPPSVEQAVLQSQLDSNRGEVLNQLALSDETLQMEIISARHQAAETLAAGCIQKLNRKATWSDRIDHWALHPWLGVPIMLLLFGFMFYITFDLTRPLSALVSGWFDDFGVWLHAVLPQWGFPDSLVSLLADGVIKGVGSTLGFLPQMVFFFFLYNLIQGSGYISRVAFLTDRVMTAFGLNGKIFIPLVVGCTCNVNGILAARILTGKYDRTVAIMASAYAPCSARLGVMVFLVSAFFDSTKATLVMLALLAISILLMASVAHLVRWFIVAEEQGTFLMEVPPYQLPQWRNLLLLTGQRTLHFLRRIKNVVVISSVVVWYLSNYPAGPFSETYIARIGLALEPLGALMGLNWQLIVALILGFSAKETALGALGILYHASDSSAGLAEVLKSAIDPVSAFTFLLVYMIYTPCLTTIFMMRQETNSWRVAIISIVGNLVFSLILGMAAYHAGTFFVGQ